MVVLLISAIGAFLGGVARNLFSRAIEGEMEAALRTWAKWCIGRAVSPLSPEVAADQEDEWLAELGTVWARPILVIRFVWGLAGAADEIATGLRSSAIAVRRRRVLLWLANVDPRDVVCRPDRTRFELVGAFFLVEFALVAFAAYVTAGVVFPAFFGGHKLLAFVVAVMAGTVTTGLDRPLAAMAIASSNRRTALCRTLLRFSLSVIVAAVVVQPVALRLLTPGEFKPISAVTATRLAGDPSRGRRSMATITGSERIGLIERSRRLDDLIEADSAALAVFIGLMLGVIAIDFGSTLLMWTGRNSLYARRQAIRSEAIAGRLEPR